MVPPCAVNATYKPASVYSRFPPRCAHLRSTFPQQARRLQLKMAGSAPAPWPVMDTRGARYAPHRQPDACLAQQHAVVCQLAAGDLLELAKQVGNGQALLLLAGHVED